MSRYVTAEVVRGQFGHLCLVINGRRVAGEKPWGGGVVVHSFEVEVLRIREALPRFRRNRTVVLEQERDEWKAWARTLADSLRSVLESRGAKIRNSARDFLAGFDAQMGPDHG